MASIIQGSDIGPASDDVTASDLHTAIPGNSMDEYADDTCLIIPESNMDSCPSEVAHIEEWAMNNNQRLNRTESAETVFVPPRSRRAIVIPPSNVSGFERVESIKAHEMMISRRFSVVQHVDALLAWCAHCLLCILCENASCQASRSVMFFKLWSWINCPILPRRGGDTRVLLIVADWISSSVCWSRSDTVTRWLPNSLISVSKRMINCMTMWFVMRRICSVHSSRQKGINNILFVTAVTTCGCQCVPQPSMTLTF